MTTDEEQDLRRLLNDLAVPLCDNMHPLPLCSDAHRQEAAWIVTLTCPHCGNTKQRATCNAHFGDLNDQLDEMAHIKAAIIDEFHIDPDSEVHMINIGSKCWACDVTLDLSKTFTWVHI